MRGILWRPCRRAFGGLLPWSLREFRRGSKRLARVAVVAETVLGKGGKRSNVVTESPKSRPRGSSRNGGGCLADLFCGRKVLRNASDRGRRGTVGHGSSDCRRRRGGPRLCRRRVQDPRRCRTPGRARGGACLGARMPGGWWLRR